MKMRAYAFGSMIAVLTLCASAAQAASFSCARQLPSDMRAICDDPRLSARDDQAAALYNQLSQSMGARGQAALKAQRLGFMRQRGACRGGVACMMGVYDDQISTLRSMSRGARRPGMATTY